MGEDGAIFRVTYLFFSPKRLRAKHYNHLHCVTITPPERRMISDLPKGERSNFSVWERKFGCFWRPASKLGHRSLLLLRRDQETDEGKR